MRISDWSSDVCSSDLYLRYPLRDMLGLLALEAWRHQAIVVGDNLGTVPDGFNQGLQEKGMLGKSVLWFQRGVESDAAGAAASCTATSQMPPWLLAMPLNHDLPPIAGWWGGHNRLDECR